MRRLARTLDAWLIARLSAMDLRCAIRVDADVTRIRLRRTTTDAFVDAILRSAILFLLGAVAVISVLCINDHFQRHSFGRETYIALATLIPAGWVGLGLLGSLCDANVRGLVIALDADAIRLDGEFFLDDRPTRGTFAYARAEVTRVVPRYGSVELEIAGVGAIVIGRFWTVAPRFEPVARALVDWHLRANLHRDPEVSLPTHVPPLNYSTPTTDHGVEIVRTPTTIRLVVGAFSNSRRASQSFHRRWPGFGLLGSWLLAAVPRKGPAVRDRLQPAVLELVLTPRELWVLSRTSPQDRLDRYRRADVVEFRRNRFGDGLYVRIVDVFAGDLPGTDRLGRFVTPIAIEVFCPMLVGPATSTGVAPEQGA